MKKSFLKTISLMLTAVFAFGFISCTKAKEGGSEANKPVVDKSAQKTDILLVDNATTEYKIVIPEDASEGESGAADELHAYLKIATGAELPIVDDDGVSLVENGKYISVGDTVLLDESGLTVSDKELNRDGYKIKRFGNSVVIGAANDLAYLYGVFEFLAYEIGFEPYASDEIYYNTDKTVYLNDFDLVDIPTFSGRNTCGPMAFNMQEQIFMRMRGFSMTDDRYDYGGSKTFIWGHSESYDAIIPRKVYNDPNNEEKYHPEWFDQSAIQMCLTNEALIDEVVKNSIAEMQVNLEGRYLNISNNDGNGWCQCSKCNKEINKYSVSGYVMRFVNKVVTRLEEWREVNQPDRDLNYCVFAYADAQVPPTVLDETTGELVLRDPSCKPHDKVSIRLVHGSCMVHVMGEGCTGFKTNYDIWRSLCNPELDFTMYDYCANYRHYTVFMDVISPLQGNMQRYKNDYKVNDIYYQNATGLNVNYMSDLINYLLGKIMWDVNCDVNALIDDFMTHYYKEAAPYVKQYLDHMRNWYAYLNATIDGGFHASLYDEPDISMSDYWPLRIVEQALEYLDQAMAATELIEDEALRDKIQRRVTVEIACTKSIIAYNYGNYYTIERTSLLEFIDTWQKECAFAGVSGLKEHDNGNATVAQLCESLKKEVQ